VAPQVSGWSVLAALIAGGAGLCVYVCPHHLPHYHFASGGGNEGLGTTTTISTTSTSDVETPAPDVADAVPSGQAEAEKEAQEAARIQGLVESGDRILGAGHKMTPEKRQAWNDFWNGLSRSDRKAYEKAGGQKARGKN
jgi:hypothetical protein